MSSRSRPSPPSVMMLGSRALARPAAPVPTERATAWTTASSGGGEDLAAKADLVGGRRLIQHAGDRGALDGGVPAPPRAAPARLSRLAERHVPELARGPGGAEGGPAIFDDRAAETGLHEQ